jgi:SAM-dependent methyltransferase
METEFLIQSPGVRRGARLERIAHDLRTGRRVTDFRFDHVYTAPIQKLSDRHWTPVEVAVRAAEFLVTDSGTRVLDVGSGVGKFCIVGALASPGLFVGVEQRPHLAEIARQAARELHASNSSFIQGNMADLDWAPFDAFYLFNPFYESQMDSIRIDDTVSHGPGQFERYVETVRSKLRMARTGTRVATYHGFGGELPPGFQQIFREAIGTSQLQVWVKMKPPSPVPKLRDESISELG